MARPRKRLIDYLLSNGAKGIKGRFFKDSIKNLFYRVDNIDNEIVYATTKALLITNYPLESQIFTVI